jgi:nucleotide-binding universal stress UspA family protein
MFRKILVATDFGESSDRAVEFATELARAFKASLVLTHTYEIPAYSYRGAPVISVGELLESIRKASQAALDSALGAIRVKIPEATAVLRGGSPWRETLDVVKTEGCDLLVVGTHGRRGLSHVLLGSVADKLVRMSPCPVLTVPGKE